jgi:hypothetical protein
MLQYQSTQPAHLDGQTELVLLWMYSTEDGKIFKVETSSTWMPMLSSVT